MYYERKSDRKDYKDFTGRFTILHKKCLILGDSKGLGKALKDQLGSQAQGVSRSTESEHLLDLTIENASEKALSLIEKSQVDYIFYVAGGGPHGNFLDKPWHSHEWALKLNLYCPVQILQNLPAEKTFIYVGSAIAERSQSDQSLSYSWSKKLMKSVILGSENPNLKLFSPPYMDTDLLPKKAWPRLECPDLVLSPNKVAEVLLDWLSSEGSSEKYFDWMERFSYDLPKDFLARL